MRSDYIDGFQLFLIQSMGRQPRSGARLQPTTQPWAIGGNRFSPEGAKE